MWLFIMLGLELIYVSEKGSGEEHVGRVSELRCDAKWQAFMVNWTLMSFL